MLIAFAVSLWACATERRQRAPQDESEVPARRQSGSDDRRRQLDLLDSGDRHPVLIDAGVGKASHLDAIANAAPHGPIARGRHPCAQRSCDRSAGDPRALAGRAIRQVSVADPRSRVGWTWLEDGSSVETDEGPLTVLHTPGHAPDHLTLWHADSRTLFVGDMLVPGSTVVIPASHGGSLAEYLRSLERMLQLNPARALPAHGPVIDDPVALIHQLHQAPRAAGGTGLGGASTHRDRPSKRSPRRSIRRCPTNWCRWRARACWRTCRSSKTMAARRAAATSGSAFASRYTFSGIRKSEVGSRN